MININYEQLGELKEYIKYKKQEKNKEINYKIKNNLNASNKTLISMEIIGKIAKFNNIVFTDEEDDIFKLDEMRKKNNKTFKYLLNEKFKTINDFAYLKTFNTISKKTKTNKKFFQDEKNIILDSLDSDTLNFLYTLNTDALLEFNYKTSKYKEIKEAFMLFIYQEMFSAYDRFEMLDTISKMIDLLSKKNDKIFKPDELLFIISILNNEMNFKDSSFNLIQFKTKKEYDLFDSFLINDTRYSISVTESNIRQHLLNNEILDLNLFMEEFFSDQESFIEFIYNSKDGKTLEEALEEGLISSMNFEEEAVNMQKEMELKSEEIITILKENNIAMFFTYLDSQEKEDYNNYVIEADDLENEFLLEETLNFQNYFENKKNKRKCKYERRITNRTIRRRGQSKKRKETKRRTKRN